MLCVFKFNLHRSPCFFFWLAFAPSSAILKREKFDSTFATHAFTVTVSYDTSDESGANVFPL